MTTRPIKQIVSERTLDGGLHCYIAMSEWGDLHGFRGGVLGQDDVGPFVYAPKPLCGADVERALRETWSTLEPGQLKPCAACFTGKSTVYTVPMLHPHMRHTVPPQPRTVECPVCRRTGYRQWRTVRIVQRLPWRILQWLQFERSGGWTACDRCQGSCLIFVLTPEWARAFVTWAKEKDGGVAHGDPAALALAYAGRS
jgi:hypothetical protein